MNLHPIVTIHDVDDADLFHNVVTTIGESHGFERVRFGPIDPLGDLVVGIDRRTDPSSAQRAYLQSLVDDQRAADIEAGLPSCRRCGCTQNAACDGGCSWTGDPDLCSACTADLDSVSTDDSRIEDRRLPEGTVFGPTFSQLVTSAEQRAARLGRGRAPGDRFEHTDGGTYVVDATGRAWPAEDDDQTAPLPTPAATADDDAPTSSSAPGDANADLEAAVSGEPGEIPPTPDDVDADGLHPGADNGSDDASAPEVVPEPTDHGPGATSLRERIVQLLGDNPGLEYTTFDVAEVVADDDVPMVLATLLELESDTVAVCYERAHTSYWSIRDDDEEPTTAGHRALVPVENAGTVPDAPEEQEPPAASPDQGSGHDTPPADRAGSPTRRPGRQPKATDEEIVAYLERMGPLAATAIAAAGLVGRGGARGRMARLADAGLVHERDDGRWAAGVAPAPTEPPAATAPAPTAGDDLNDTDRLVLQVLVDHAEPDEGMRASEVPGAFPDGQWRPSADEVSRSLGRLVSAGHAVRSRGRYPPTGAS